MAEITQTEVDALKTDLMLVSPSGKLAEVEADVKAKAHFPLEAQARFIRRMIDKFENAELEKYDAPKSKTTNSDGSRKRPEKTNPWSKEGWNVSAQGKLVLSLGEAKAAEIAQAAGCKIGSTKFNPDYV
jgi:hypothetical protein